MALLRNGFEDQQSTSKRLRVLVVDDNEDVGQCLTLLLQRMGHVARACLSGQDGLACLRDFRPQVILLDLSMPGQDGFEICRLIRQTGGFENVAIIACSALDPYLVDERARQCHFSHYLVKPVSLRQLQAAIEEAVEEQLAA